MRHPLPYLLSLTLLAMTLTGCATAPTSDAIDASAARLATVAYITRAETAQGQARRAADLVRMADALSTYAMGQGTAGIASEVNRLVLAADLSPADRALAQAVLTEAVLIAGDSGGVLPPDQAARLVAALDQVRAVAKVFAGGAA